MKYGFRIVDVFSDRPFGGNQLAVLTDARGLSDDQMQSIAREFNFAETTFVLPPEIEGGPPRVRIFTPRAELPFAGHPSIGTAAVLVREGLAPAGTVTLGLAVGPVAVDVAERGEAMEGVLIREGEAEVRPSDASAAQLAEALSLPADAVAESFDASAGLPFSFVRLVDEAAVDRAKIDRDAWERNLANAWTRGIYFFAGELGDGGRLHARMFAPVLGVDEDPATGSACVALAGAAAARSGIRDGAFRLAIRQGVLMGRPSAIDASAELAGGKVVSVRVGGGVSFFAAGQLEIG
jgi:trans-2,3-dihydro-3-hydroxyanthranilate isomerase